MRKIAYRLLLGVLLCTVTALTGCSPRELTYVYGTDEKTEASESGSEPEESTRISDMEDEPLELIPVYVCGAVKEPGVYYLSSDGIKQDALLAAGGFGENAARDYINLADAISEGERIYVPYLSDISASDAQTLLTGDMGSSLTDGKVHLNTATKEQLMTLSGIGESRADAILAYRTEHGRFNSVDELLCVSGIKEGVYGKIKDNIVLD